MDNGKVYDLTSGAKLYVSVCEYEKVMALHDALVAELRGNGAGALDVGKIQKAIEVTTRKRLAAAAGQVFEDDGAGDEGFNAIVDRLLALAGSRSVKAALFACADKAVYRPDGQEASSIQMDPAAAGYGIFDHPKYKTQARGDFYDICRAIAEENLRPFGKALFSTFLGLVANSADSPASSSAPA